MPPESPSSLLFLFKEETIPHVTVLERDMGLPTATTHSPGRSDADEPSAIKGRFVYNKPSSHRETNVCSYMYCLRHNYHWATCTFTCTSRDDAKPWYSTQWLLQFPVGHHLAFHSLLVQDCDIQKSRPTWDLPLLCGKQRQEASHNDVEQNPVLEDWE